MSWTIISDPPQNEGVEAERGERGEADGEVCEVHGLAPDFPIGAIAPRAINDRRATAGSTVKAT
jgi:hypothetical protein